MKILVLGAGAVGGYFGGRLVQKGDEDADVTFLVRQKRAQEIVMNGGLTIENHDGQITTISPVKTIISEEGFSDSSLKLLFDVIILACKSYGLSGALDAIAPFVHSRVRILPLLNGMAHIESIQKRFPNVVVWGGTCGIVATLTPNGIVKKMTEAQFVVAGASLKKSSDQSNSSADSDDILRNLIKLMTEAGINASVSGDIIAKMWEKWSFLATLAAATCLMDGSVGEILFTDYGKDYIEGVYQECNKIATSAMGKEMDPDQQKTMLQRVFGDRNSIVRASMSRDMQNGNPTEADHVLGDMIRRAKQFCISTPLLSIASSRLQIYESQRQHKEG